MFAEHGQNDNFFTLMTTVVVNTENTRTTDKSKYIRILCVEGCVCVYFVCNKLRLVAHTKNI